MNSNSFVCLMLISNKGSLIFAFFHCFNVEWSVLNEASSPARHACVFSHCCLFQAQLVTTAMGNIHLYGHTHTPPWWRNDASVWGTESIHHFCVFQSKRRVFAARLSVWEALEQQILCQQLLTSQITSYYWRTTIPPWIITFDFKSVDLEWLASDLHYYNL